MLFLFSSASNSLIKQKVNRSHSHFLIKLSLPLLLPRKLVINAVTAVMWTSLRNWVHHSLSDWLVCLWMSVIILSSCQQQHMDSWAADPRVSSDVRDITDHHSLVDSIFTGWSLLLLHTEGKGFDKFYWLNFVQILISLREVVPVLRSKASVPAYLFIDNVQPIGFCHFLCKSLPVTPHCLTVRQVLSYLPVIHLRCGWDDRCINIWKIACRNLHESVWFTDKKVLCQPISIHFYMARIFNTFFSLTL